VIMLKRRSLRKLLRKKSSTRRIYRSRMIFKMALTFLLIKVKRKKKNQPMVRLRNQLMIKLIKKKIQVMIRVKRKKTSHLKRKVRRKMKSQVMKKQKKKKLLKRKKIKKKLMILKMITPILSLKMIQKNNKMVGQ